MPSTFFCIAQGAKSNKIWFSVYSYTPFGCTTFMNSQWPANLREASSSVCCSLKFVFSKNFTEHKSPKPLSPSHQGFWSWERAIDNSNHTPKPMRVSNLLPSRLAWSLSWFTLIDSKGIPDYQLTHWFWGIIEIVLMCPFSLDQNFNWVTLPIIGWRVMKMAL